MAKTTTCLNLGIALANAGNRVLLVDLDPQGSLTESLGFHNPDEMDDTLATAISDMLRADDNLLPVQGRRGDPEGKREPGDNLSQKYGTRGSSDETDAGHAGLKTMRHVEGVVLIPGNIELAGIEVSLVNVMCRESILKELLRDVRPHYSYVLIGSMPSLGMLTINALVAADSVLVPVSTAYLPAKGLEPLLLTISKVRRQLNRKLKIEGILLSMVDSRTNFWKEIIDQIHTSTFEVVRRKNMRDSVENVSLLQKQFKASFS